MQFQWLYQPPVPSGAVEGICSTLVLYIRDHRSYITRYDGNDEDNRPSLWRLDQLIGKIDVTVFHLELLTDCITSFISKVQYVI